MNYLIFISDLIGLIGFFLAFFLCWRLYSKTKEIFPLWSVFLVALLFLVISALISTLENYGFDLSIFGTDPEMPFFLVAIGILFAFIFFTNQDFIKPIYDTVRSRAKILLVSAISILFLVLVLFGILFPYNNSISVREADVQLLTSFTNSQANEISSLLRMFEYDIFLVANNPHLKGYVNNLGENNLDLVAQDYLTLSDTKNWYYQIRFIDEFGNETVRVDKYNLSNPSYVVAKDKLQYKGDRYYFPDTFKLEAGQIFISPIDLNKEGTPAKVELPFKPVIRYGLPIFDSQGFKKGITITNADFGAILNYLDSSEDNVEGDQVFLVDSNGQYLFNTNHSKEWGAAVNLNTSYNLNQDYPMLAKKVFSSDEGVLIGDIGGVATFKKIYISELDRTKFIVLISFIPSGNYVSP